MSEEVILWMLGLEKECTESEMLDALNQAVSCLDFDLMMRARRIAEDVGSPPPRVAEALRKERQTRASADGLIADLGSLHLLGPTAELKAVFDMGRWLAGGVSELKPEGLAAPWQVEERSFFPLDEWRPLLSDATIPQILVKRYVSADGQTFITRFQLPGRAEP